MYDCYDTSFFTQSQIEAILEIWDSPATAERRWVKNESQHEPEPEDTLDAALDCDEAA